MERYENIIKIEEIRRLTDDNQYVKALRILKTLDTNKIKSLTDLSIIADVYTQNEEYDDAMKILTRIYAKNKTRRIVYQLVDLSIKKGDIYESEYYLDKYKKLASRDSYQYIFRYCIDKLKEEPYDVLIASLEKLKEYEYFEVWAYELAKLYHKAGMKDKCVRECSDIILWFGNGIYVEKARLLKAYYVGEVNPIHMLKAKEKKETEARLGLDKTKDYSNIRSEIDKFLAENDESSQNNTVSKEEPLAREDEYGVNEIADGIVESIDNEREENSSNRNSAYEELYSAGVFTENSYDEEYPNELEIYQEDQNEESNDEVAASATLNIYHEENILEEVNESEEILVEDELEENGVTEGKIIEDEIVQDDIVENEIAEDEFSKDEIAENEIAEDELAKDQVVKDELVQDVVEEILISADEIEEDEIERMIRLIHLKENVYLKKIFGYFICKPECNEQIETVLNRLLLKKDKGQNLIIIGQRKSGKTTLGKCFAKALYDQNLIKTPKVAKITATKLNRINLLERVDVLVDGTLIIEEAGNLTHGTVEQLMQVIHTYGARLLVSLEDEEGNMDELLKREDKLSSYFENVIKIPEFSGNDKLGFVLCFLEDQDYKLSPKGKEILLNALEEIEKNVEESEQLEVLFNFVKKAKLSADERNKSHLLNIMQSRSLDKNDLLYIKEEDFDD